MSYIRNRSSDSIENDVDGDSLSVADTTSSDYSSDISNLQINELISPKPPTTNISACVANSTNVTLGTVFNGPVAITNLVVKVKKVKRNITEKYNDQPDQPKTGIDNTFISDQKGLYSFESNRRLTLFVLVVVVASVALVTAIIVAVYFMYFLCNVPTVRIENGDYEFIDRDEYGALPPKEVGEPLSLPVKRVIISHTATTSCEDYLECVSTIRKIESFHRDFADDIGYNFLVGGDGRAYEGRGYKVGAHTLSYNRDSICIAFIGSFTLYAASQYQLRAAQMLIDNGVKTNKIHPDYVLYGQRQLGPSDSPGRILYYQIMAWPHWSKKIIPL